MLTLGIETSCDETAASVIKNRGLILSNVVSSSVHLHRRFGGIIPEIASRYHIEYITAVVDTALKQAGAGMNDIDLVSVTYGPGLIGALLVGVCFTKGLSLATGIPFIGINHLQAHLYATLMQTRKDLFPFVGMVVSGGHSLICFVEDVGRFTLLGQTKDDAVGEAFDKVAKILGLGYPGGPVIEKRAARGNYRAVRFSAFVDGKSLSFSFSGIKTAVLYYVREQQKKTGRAKLPARMINNICAGFQQGVVDALVQNAMVACRRKNTPRLVLGGGVSINAYLRLRMEEAAKKEKIRVFFPEGRFCLDNAAMVAGLAYQRFQRGERSDFNLAPRADLNIETN